MDLKWNVMGEPDNSMDSRSGVEYAPNVKMEPVITEPVNIIQLKQADIGTEHDVVVKRSQLTLGKITPISNTYQSNLLNDEHLFTILTIGDTRYLSLPQTSEPLAIIIPASAMNRNLTQNISNMEIQQDKVSSRSVKAPTLSVILPQLVKKAVKIPKINASRQKSANKTTVSKRKPAHPLKSTNLSELKASLEPKPHPCDQCTKTFANQQSLKAHQIIKHKKETYRCDLCQESFLYRRDLIEHEKYHPDWQKFCCEICGEEFPGKIALKKHVIVHEPTEYHCDRCPKKFTQKAGYRRHVQAHNASTPTMNAAGEAVIPQCEICFKHFKSTQSLKLHRRTHQSNGVSFRYKCEHCDEGFDTERSLKCHTEIHTKGKPLMCENCGKRFLRSEGLRRHMITHTGEKPHECKWCQKRFGREENLIQHVRTHTGEKPYSCEECGKTFARYTTCIEHKRLHTGEKPFHCEVCGKDFRRCSYLTVHMRLHTGKNPFKCEHCDKAYPQKVQLKLHMKSHHPEKPNVA